MINNINTHFIYGVTGIIILLILLLLFFIYILILDKKLTKLENKIKKDFRKRLDFIPVLYDLSSGKIKMHKKMFEKVLDYRNIGIFNYKQMKFIEVVNNEINIHKELIFLFKAINKLNSLKSKKDYIYVENFFDKNSINISEKINLYKFYSKILNKLVKIKNFTVIGFIIPVKKKDIL